MSYEKAANSNRAPMRQFTVPVPTARGSVPQASNGLDTLGSADLLLQEKKKG
jgi:hypothetical protein